MVERWRELKRAETPESRVPPLNQYMHMTEMQCSIWTNARPRFVSGSDEVGKGAWAGPLVVCAVCAPYEWSFPGLRDSKKLSSKQIEKIAGELREEATKGNINYHMTEVSADQIDSLGTQTAMRLAHKTALDKAAEMTPEAMMVLDGDLMLPGFYIAIPKADTFIPQVSAAAILAKYARDSTMKFYAPAYPEYGFEHHVGYGTAEHKEAVQRYGLCSLHRKTYKLNLEGRDERPAGESESFGGFASADAERRSSTDWFTPVIPEQRRTPRNLCAQADRRAKKGAR